MADSDPIRAESPQENARYNNAHRALVQAFMAQPVMTIEELKPLVSAILTAQGPHRPTLPGDITAPLLTTLLQPINTRLLSLDYEIRSTKDQTTKTATYALVNTTSDLPTQLATTFSADEIAYIKRVLDAMFETNNTPQREVLAVSGAQAADLARLGRRARMSQAQAQGQTQLQTQNPSGEADDPPPAESSTKGLTLSESEAVLAKLVAQRFFARSRAGYYSLAPRGLMELRNFLKDTYNEPANPEDAEDEGLVRVRDCHGCREIVTVGVRCEDRACGVRFHDGCAGLFFRSHRAGRKCPGCGGEWTGGLFVGERAVAGGKGRSGGRGREEDEE